MPHIKIAIITCLTLFGSKKLVAQSLEELNPIDYDAPKAGQYDIIRGFNLFTEGSRPFRPSAIYLLDSIATVIQALKDERFQLEFHVDCRGDSAYNRYFTQRIADSAVAYIERKISSGRLKAVGMGEDQPLIACRCEDNNRSDCLENQHQYNRRLQLRVIGCARPPAPYHIKTIKRYESIRMEGLPFSQAVKKGLAYCGKYVHKSPHTLAYQAMGIYPDTASLQGNETAISLAFVGDIMWMRGNTRNLVTPELKQFLQAHDLVFGNLETPVSQKHRHKNFFIDYISYNEDTSIINNFNDNANSSIFTGLSVANNHSLDRGLVGLKNTNDYLLSKGITPMGASAFDSLPLYHCFQSHGLKFGVFAGAWGLNNPANLHTPNLRFHLAPHLAFPYPKREMNNKAYQALQQMNHDQVDVKIIFMHWGFEFEYFPDTLIREEAMLLSSLGADIIVGAHPHVVQPWDYIASPTTPEHSTLCYYSLGNFCSYMFSSPCKNGLIASIKVYPRAAQKPLIVAKPPAFVYTHKQGWRGKKTKLFLIQDQWKQKPTWLPPARWKEIKKSLAIIGVQ